jgi:HEPN domain-containing protein
VELRFPNSPAKDYFEKAWNHIEEADRQFSLGNWEETLTSCRKAIEVVDNLENAEDVAKMVGEEKWERMGRLKGDLSNYLSLGSHSDEGIGHEQIKRRDAQSALWMSKSVINYIGDALRERED